MRGLNDQEYHLAELRIATDPANADHVLPDVPAGCAAVLDIGCGAGQTLIALRLPPHVLACGVDPDESALELGRQLAQTLKFAAAGGERLPFTDGAFDFVYSRVALPYTNIPVALREARRVLRPGGRVWLTLHRPRMAVDTIISGVRRRSLRGVVYGIYVLVNGLLLHVNARLLRWPLGRARYESVQTRTGMIRALRRAGFSDAEVTLDRFFVATARRS